MRLVCAKRSLAVFKALDNRRKQAIEARAAAVAQARERAQQQIAQAKAQHRAGSRPPPAPLWKPTATASPTRSFGTILQSAGSGPAAVVGGR